MRFILGTLVILLLASCASTTVPAGGVQRIAVDSSTDLSGRWNDTDARQVAEKMTASLLSNAWLENYKLDNAGLRPTIIVGHIKNETSEHINTGIFAKSIEAELINSGELDFVADPNERAQIRNEREDQQSNSSESTMKLLAQETGADFMMTGAIQSNVDAIEGRKTIYYQVSMQLVNLESNRKAWLDTEEIKKDITRSTASTRPNAPRTNPHSGNSDW